MQDHVILVDNNDREIGIKEKLQAHRDGDLHRALSVFVFNQQGQWLLQRRALTKYHSPGLWTNTCCSHPRPRENVVEAAYRRLKEEMGIKCVLTKLFDFTYFAQLEEGLTEHEFDHVFIGQFEGDVFPHPDEVCEWKWMDEEGLQEDLSLCPQYYTVWFKLIQSRVYLNLPDQLSFVRSVAK